jgi:outer membrane factor, OMF family
VGKTNKTIEAVSIATAIILSNAALAAAGDLQAKPAERLNLKESSKLDAFPVPSEGEATSLSNLSTVNLSADLLTQSIGIGNLSMPIQISQAPPEISEPAQQPITDPSQLEPIPNPLLFPTQPDEVRVNPQQAISLQQAIELALKNNKEIDVARLTVERSQEALTEARAGRFPTVDLQGAISTSDSASEEISNELRLDEGFPLADDELDTSTNTFNSDLSVGYNIYTSGRVGAEIRSAEKQLSFDRLDLERVVEQTRFETSRDYYNLQSSDAEVNIEQAAVEDARQTLKDAQLLEQAGLGTRFDVLRAEVEVANAQQRLTTAEANQDVARRQLAETLSLGQKADLKTADAIAEVGTWNLSLEESIIQAYKNRAELEQFLLQREINQEERTIALAEVRPQVRAVASYNVLSALDESTGLADGYSLEAQVQWTVFDGGAARARAEQAETNAEISATEFANQRNNVRFEVEQAYYQLLANRENIATANKAVELAQESLRLARLRFSAGVGTQTDVIQSQTELTTARGNQLSAIIEYNQSYNQLRRAVTNLPDGGLLDLP